MAKRAVFVAAGLLAGLISAHPASAAPAAAASYQGAAATGAQDTCTAPAGLKLQDQDYDDDQLPWQRKNGEEVVIYFATKGLPAAYLDDVNQGIVSWDRSPCVQPKTTDTCKSGTYCVTIGLEDSDDDDDDGNFDAVEKGKYTVGGHITYYTEPLEEEGPVAMLNVVKHEMGHAIGLRHRLNPKALMNGDTNNTTEPDQIDYDNLLVLYGRQ